MSKEEHKTDKKTLRKRREKRTKARAANGREGGEAYGVMLQPRMLPVAGSNSTAVHLPNRELLSLRTVAALPNA